MFPVPGSVFIPEGGISLPGVWWAILLCLRISRPGVIRRDPDADARGRERGIMTVNLMRAVLRCATFSLPQLAAHICVCWFVQVQNHVRKMWLWQQRHLLVPTRGCSVSVSHPQSQPCPAAGANLRWEVIHTQRTFCVFSSCFFWTVTLSVTHSICLTKCYTVHDA